MLSKTKSQRSAQLRFLLLLPLMAGFICCCAAYRKNEQILIEGNRVRRAGMEISNGSLPPLDTLRMSDREQGSSQLVLVQGPARPEKLNGQTILQSYDLLPPATGQLTNMRELISRAGIEPILCALPDNESYGIALDAVIIAPSGQIAQYCLNLYRRRDGNHDIITAKTMAVIQQKLATVLMAPAMNIPRGKDKAGMDVPYFLGAQDGYAAQQKFTIKDNHIFYLSW